MSRLMLCNLGNTSTAGNDTNNNANTNSSMEDDDSYPLPTIYRYVNRACPADESEDRRSLPNVAPRPRRRRRGQGEFSRDERERREKKKSVPERTMPQRCGTPAEISCAFRLKLLCPSINSRGGDNARETNSFQLEPSPDGSYFERAFISITAM